MNHYSKVVSGKKKRTYEFFPFVAAEELKNPVEDLEKRAEEYERRKKSGIKDSKQVCEAG